MNTLVIKNLNKSFADNLVIKNFNLTVAKGEIVAIVGPSGQGKSTLLRCIAGLEKPTSGTISIRGNTGMIFQSYNLFPNLTALKNITLSLIKTQRIEKVDAEKKAIKLLDSVGLKEKVNFYPTKLSGGQQQRVAIARAIALDPELILFDEPTSALDPKLKNEIMSLIKEITLTRNCATVFITHEIRYAKKIASRIVSIMES